MRPSEVTSAKFLTAVAADVVRRSRGDSAHDPLARVACRKQHLSKPAEPRDQAGLHHGKQSPPTALTVGEATLGEIAVDKDLDSKGQIVAERS
jgi:hypothetical protein